MTAQSAIEPVPGWSALTLTIRGANLEMGTIAAVPFSIIAGFLPGTWYYWSGLIGGVAFTVLTVGFVWTMKSFRRSRQEIRAGYTTIPKVALQRPELVYVTAKTHQVISGPNEPRPRSGRRCDIEEHMAKRAQSAQ